MQYNKAILILFVLAILSASALAEPICEYSFIIYKNNSVELIKTRAFEGVQDRSIAESPYQLKIFDVNGKAITTFGLPVSFLISAHPVIDDSATVQSVKLPCSNEGYSLVLYKDNSQLFEKDIKGLFCNSNGICEKGENYVSCSSDCMSGSEDGYCDRVADDRCDPDCYDMDADCPARTSTLRAGYENISECNNNRICETYENYVNCPSDCRFEPQVEAQENVTVQEQKKVTEVAVETKQAKNKNFLLIFGLEIVALIIVWIMIKKLKKED